jgi:hypothetical protein
MATQSHTPPHPFSRPVAPQAPIIAAQVDAWLRLLRRLVATPPTPSTRAAVRPAVESEAA